MTWALPSRDIFDPRPTPPTPPQLQKPEIKRALTGAKIAVTTIDHRIGPTVIRYLVTLADGVPPSKVERAIDAVSLAVGTTARYAGPQDGAVVIEVPRKHRRIVSMREAIEELPALVSLGFPLGIDAAGEARAAHLTKLPHLLVAGTTGSGKSSFVNSLLIGLLARNTPADLRLVMIDPKKVELALYDDLPHLAAPIITDVGEALRALIHVAGQMDDRYQAFKELGVKDLQGFNDRATERLPRIVVVIDEFADLILTAGRAVEDVVVRIAQLGRAAGIHLVVATQQPLQTVITSLIKANIPARAVFAVADHRASGVALGRSGAERLSGAGDGLWNEPAVGAPIRFQSPFVSEAEIVRMVRFWSQQAPAAPERPALEVVDTSEQDAAAAAYRAALDAGPAPWTPEGVAAGKDFLLPEDIIHDMGLTPLQVDALVAVVAERVMAQLTATLERAS